MKNGRRSVISCIPAGFLFLWVIANPSTLLAQDTVKCSFSGYLSNLFSTMGFFPVNDLITDDLTHNRLNFSYTPWRLVDQPAPLTVVAEMRNRFLWGESVAQDPLYAGRLENDPGYLDFLTHNIISEKSCVLNTTFDRFYARTTWKKLEVTLGRQRINWGQSFVWNPNDLFNVYSFFDFDYVERPGSDALRLQYYPTATSAMEGVLKADSSGRITAAALYRTNLWHYDIQLLAGYFNEEDYVVGAGWSGSIGNAGCKGEMSYFFPEDPESVSENIFLASLDLDYLFQNSLYLQGEILYSTYSPATRGVNLMEYYQGGQDVRKLALSTWTLFGQVSYPVSPLVNTSFSVMYMPDIQGFYTGPTLSWSVAEDLDLSLIAQYFKAEKGMYTFAAWKPIDLLLGYLRLKWSF